MPDVLIVGLGNPGRRYERTRHNIGFFVADALAAAYRAPAWKSEKQALTSRALVGQHSVLLAKPQLFMNNSGVAVQALARYHNVDPASIVVVSDDLDLPFGRLRLRPGGSAGGHNGLRSIIAQLGTTEFPRLKIGIGRPVQDETIDWVLSDFPPEQVADLPRICAAAVQVLTQYIEEGIIAAMNACNGVQDIRQPKPRSEPVIADPAGAVQRIGQERDCHN